jgi:hypothetical protein
MSVRVGRLAWHRGMVVCLGFVAVVAAGSLGLLAADKPKGVWTDPQDPALPIEFKIQGEYVGRIEGGDALGCQVIALGPGAFQAVLLPGGLPGEGWDGKNKMLMDGRLEGDQAVFAPASGNRQYLAGNPQEFSASRQFPPVGHKPCTATASGEAMNGKTDEGQTKTASCSCSRRSSARARRRALRRPRGPSSCSTAATRTTGTAGGWMK